MRISVEATERLARAARAPGLNAEMPTFVSRLFQRAIDAGYREEEVAAIIKVLRATAANEIPVASARMTFELGFRTRGLTGERPFKTDTPTVHGALRAVWCASGR